MDFKEKVVFRYASLASLVLLPVAVISEIILYIDVDSPLLTIALVISLLLFLVVLFGYQKYAQKEKKRLLANYLYFFAPALVILSLLQFVNSDVVSLVVELALQLAIIVFAILLLTSFKKKIIRAIAILELVSVVMYLGFILTYVVPKEKLAVLPWFVEMTLASFAVAGFYGLIAFDVAVYLLQYFFFKKETK